MKYNTYLNRFKYGLGPLGFVISLTGSIPPGMITVGVIQTTLNKGIGAGCAFSLGAALTETAMVGLILGPISKMVLQDQWLRRLRQISLVALIALTLAAGYTLVNPQPIRFGPSNTGIPHLLAGILLRIITPTMLIFWAGWNLTLYSFHLFPKGSTQTAKYLLGIGVGTITAHALYILMSRQLLPHLPSVQTVVQAVLVLVLGSSTLVVAYQLYGRPRATFS